MRRLCTLSFLFVVSACVGIRDDPRDTQPASVFEVKGTGGTGGTGGAGGGGTGGTGGGGVSMSLAQCSCGMNFLNTLGNQLPNECNVCIADLEVDIPVQCAVERDDCEASTVCFSVLNSFNQCQLFDADCLDNVNGQLDEDSLDLLSRYFACICDAGVCGGVCTPEPALPSDECGVLVNP